MEKKTKIKVMIASIFAIILLVLYVIISMNYREPVVEELVYIPSGNMSDSWFDYQNMVSIPAEGFENVYSYKYMPIDVFIPNTMTANVNNVCFAIYGDNYVFTSEISVDETYDDLVYELGDEFTQIINSKADAKKTVVSCLNEEDGYINGCGGLCHTFEISVDGESNLYYATVYELIPCEDFGLGDPVIIIGCLGMGKDEGYMQQRYDIATEMVRTLNMDWKRKEKEFNVN